MKSQRVETITLHPSSGTETRKVKKDDLVIIPENQDVKAFFEMKMDEIYTKLYNRIEHMLETNKDEVYVFIYKGKAFSVKRDSITRTLKKMINHCIKPENEKYELAARAHELLKRL